MKARLPTHAAPPKETLAGTVERVTFHNAESGFCVLKVQARGKRDLITLIAHAPAIGAGEWVTATCLWIADRQHGLQFKAETLKVTPPTGVEGIEKYLASGYMRGIGPAMAKRIVAAFGDGTFEIIEAEPDRLKEVSGIGPMRAYRIVAGWAEQNAVREIMLFLHAHGVGTTRAVRIFETYGYDAITVMTEGSYRLARDIRGIGFKTAEARGQQDAAKLGHPPAQVIPARPVLLAERSLEKTNQHFLLCYLNPRTILEASSWRLIKSVSILTMS